MYLTLFTYVPFSHQQYLNKERVLFYAYPVDIRNSFFVKLVFKWNGVLFIMNKT